MKENRRELLGGRLTVYLFKNMEQLEAQKNVARQHDSIIFGNKMVNEDRSVPGTETSRERISANPDTVQHAPAYYEGSVQEDIDAVQHLLSACESGNYWPAVRYLENHLVGDTDTPELRALLADGYQVLLPRAEEGVGLTERVRRVTEVEHQEVEKYKPAGPNLPNADTGEVEAAWEAYESGSNAGVLQLVEGVLLEAASLSDLALERPRLHGRLTPDYINAVRSVWLDLQQSDVLHEKLSDALTE